MVHAVSIQGLNSLVTPSASITTDEDLRISDPSLVSCIKTKVLSVNKIILITLHDSSPALVDRSPLRSLSLSSSPGGNAEAGTPHTRAFTETLRSKATASCPSPPSPSRPIIIQLLASILSRHHGTTPSLSPPSLLPALPFCSIPPTGRGGDGDGDVLHGGWATHTDMSRRVGSDLNHRRTIGNDGSGSAGKAKQKLSLLFPGVGAWRRSDGNGGGGAKNRNDRAGKQRRGLEIGQVLRKYVSMVEQLFAPSSGGRRERERRDLRQRPQSFTTGHRGGGGGGGVPSKRHNGRLSSAPASLKGSPANSGRLCVGESSVKVSTSSEVSTMEELQSAIQAAIAHCKNSVAVAKQAGGDECKC
ncbi:hypothetical protein ACP4OV_018099 [Aristida adscensionis]